MGSVTMGVDVGQKIDPTAIAVAESEWEPRVTAGGNTVQEDHFYIRHLQRLPLGTKYPAVAEELATLVGKLISKAGSLASMFVDATGVGLPLVDMLQAGISYPTIIPVYFTHGDRRTVDKDEQGRKQVKLGKAWLVSRLQVLLRTERLHLPDTPEAHVLIDELLNYEIKVDEDANEKYGAFKVGTHDDLVTAVGLAVQEAVAPAQGYLFSKGRDIRNAPGNPFIGYNGRIR